MSLTVSSSHKVIAAVVLLFSAIACSSVNAQVTILPSIGLQTMWFNGDYPVSQPISPGIGKDLPLGGGMMSSNNGIRLQAEIIPVPKGILRFPVSIEAYTLSGRTTFSASSPTDTRKRRLFFENFGNIISAGLGVTATFFKLPSLYFSAEGRITRI